MKLKFYAFLFIIFFTINLNAESKLDNIQQAISKKNATWQAAENSISRLSKDEFRKLLGSPIDYIPLNAEEKYIEIPKAESLPASFDWRNNNGNWLTSVKSQGGCGSCWDFSAVSQIEAWWKIHNDMPDSNINLSEQFILSCGSEAGSCEGGWSDQALEFVKNNGIPQESFMPYQANDGVSCSSVSTGWEATSVTIPGWGYITLEEIQVINIKNALMHHPVSANYIVYEDFAYYNGGVYEHTFGEYDGGHAILIVGWENECWICKNSWGSNWGENGYFRIKWKDSNMGTFIPFIYDEMVDDVQLSFSEESIFKELPAGNSSTETISITNNSSSTIDLYTSDSQDPILFHRSTFNAFSGKSWWCGTKEFSGYSNHWLQYLETPLIDLSSASNPELDFMAKWSIELPGGTDAPYDGWDGWNVWISTDDGENYSIINPVSPSYTNNALWAFGHPEQGWNMGTSVKGWSGYSAHWIPVKFDLSSYSGQQVKFRFAFASDMGYSSEDDKTLEGLFLDDIVVTDNESVIFSDNAENDSQMEPSGFGDLPNDWLDIYYNNNRLAAGESMDVQLNFIAPSIAGKYSGEIKFMSNNNNKDLPSIPVELAVGQPNSDLAIGGFNIPSNNINLNFNRPIEIYISNNGKSSQSDLIIKLTDSRGLLDESQTIEVIDPGQTKTLFFEASLLEGQYDATLIASTTIDDDNLSNNIDSIDVTISNLIDTFERFNSFWNFEGYINYSIFNPNNGLYNIYLYEASENSLFFQLPITIENKDYHFEFFAKISDHSTQLVIEFSYDNANWIESDTINISGYDFTKYQIKKNFNQSHNKVWFRLKGKTNDANFIYLDDFSLLTTDATSIDNLDKKLTDFRLNQNYPNPFNPTTVIEYQIPKKSDVSLNIFDITGKLVETLVNENQQTGIYKVNWDASNQPTGIYFYKLMMEDQSKTQKMILMK